MRRMPRVVAAALLAAVVTGAGCARDAATAPGVRVTGRLVDGETGRPVSRRSVWVHGFSDDAGRQVTLDPEDEADFEMSLPTPNVRLRVFDSEHAYELYEQKFTAQGGALDVDVRLVPTHWVRLHGKVLWRDGARLRPLAEGDGNVRHAMVHFDRGARLSPAPDGTYSVRAPREPLRIVVVDTNYAPAVRELDLSGETADEREFDVILEK